jgi:chromosome segregation ATPase
MTARGIREEKREQSIDQWIEEPIRRTLSQVEEEIEEVTEEGAPGAAESVVGKKIVMPEIKGLEILKEGAYSVDLEKTIGDMFATIRNMESQLETVLSINTYLEKDLKASKELIAALKGDKAKLEQIVSGMKEEIPSKREFQIEIDHLVEERNVAEAEIRSLKHKLEKTHKTVAQLQSRIAALADEKRDAATEINFLESKLSAVQEKMKRYENEINILKGEKLAHLQKIKSLEEQFSEELTEKYRYLKELKDSRVALDEIRSTLTETKRQAKKSFYKTSEERESELQADT